MRELQGWEFISSALTARDAGVNTIAGEGVARGAFPFTPLQEPGVQLQLQITNPDDQLGGELIFLGVKQTERSRETNKSPTATHQTKKGRKSPARLCLALLLKGLEARTCLACGFLNPRPGRGAWQADVYPT